MDTAMNTEPIRPNCMAKAVEMTCSTVSANFGEGVAMILFGIGFANLLFQKNLIKKIIGFDLMDTAVFMFLAGINFSCYFFIICNI